MIRLMLFVAAALVSCFAFAQAPKPEGDKFNPRSLPNTSIRLENVVLAKATADKSAIMLLIPQFTSKTRTRTVNVVRMVTETRTRSVEDGAGGTRLETYSVEVPVTEQREQTYNVTVLKDTVKKTIPLAEFRAWRISGDPIDGAELLRQLAEPTHLFVEERDPTQKFEGCDPFYAEIFRPGALVLYVAPGKLMDGAATAPSAAPPAVAVPAQPAPAPPMPAPKG